MDPVELGHPDVQYRPLEEDSGPINKSSDSQAGDRDEDLPLHEVEVRIAYLRYEQQRQAQVVGELKRQLWIARSKWQDKLDDLWSQYCALKYDTEDPCKLGARQQGGNRQTAQELFDCWRELYRDTIGLARYRFLRAQEEERGARTQMMSLQARRLALLRQEDQSRHDP